MLAATIRVVQLHIPYIQSQVEFTATKSSGYDADANSAALKQNLLARRSNMVLIPPV